MSFVSHTNFVLEVGKKNIPGHVLDIRFGRNDNMSSGGDFQKFTEGGVTGALPTPDQVRVKAGGNVDDDAGGTGVHKIGITGIDSLSEPASEIITLAGASASAPTSKSWWRINQAVAVEGGTYYGTNVGAITIESITPTVQDILTIKADEGLSQHGIYSIPLGFTGFLMGAEVTIDANKSADVRMVGIQDFDNEIPPYKQKRLLGYFPTIQGSVELPLAVPATFSERSEFFFEALPDSMGTDGSVYFSIILIDNEFTNLLL